MYWTILLYKHVIVLIENVKTETRKTFNLGNKYQGIRIRKLLRDLTREPKAKSFLSKRISITNLRGNAESVLITLAIDKEKIEDVFYVI